MKNILKLIFLKKFMKSLNLWNIHQKDLDQLKIKSEIIYQIYEIYGNTNFLIDLLQTKFLYPSHNIHFHIFVPSLIYHDLYGFNCFNYDFLNINFYFEKKYKNKFIKIRNKIYGQI